LRLFIVRFIPFRIQEYLQGDSLPNVRATSATIPVEPASSSRSAATGKITHNGSSLRSGRR
ncbi:MAG: hypothetical protein ACRD22_19610, partial [Terriglobia bacterium]